MLWLVQSELGGARNREGGHKAPSRVDDRTSELDPLLLQLLDGCLDVVAHQIELMVAALLRGMGRKLGWRKPEDEPTASSVDRREAEHVAKECPRSFWIAGEDDRMGADDHRATLLAQSLRARSCANAAFRDRIGMS